MAHHGRVAEPQLDGPAIRGDRGLELLPLPRRHPALSPASSCSSSLAMASGTRDQSGRRAFSSVSRPRASARIFVLRPRASATVRACQLRYWARQNWAELLVELLDRLDLRLGLLRVAGSEGQLEELEARLEALGLLLGQPGPGPAAPARSCWRAQVGGQLGQQLAAVLPARRPRCPRPGRSGSRRPAARPGDREPCAGQPDVRPGRRASAWPRPADARAAGNSFRCDQQLDLHDPEPDLLGNRLRAVSSTSIALSFWPCSTSISARNSSGSVVPGRRRRRVGEQPLDLAPLALRLRQPTIPLDQQRGQRQPDLRARSSRAPGIPGSPRRSGPASISPWIHPSRAAPKSGLVL